jgi:hypothetical protein
VNLAEYHIDMARLYGRLTEALWELARLQPRERAHLEREASTARQQCVSHILRARSLYGV